MEMGLNQEEVRETLGEMSMLIPDPPPHCLLSVSHQNRHRCPKVLGLICRSQPSLPVRAHMYCQFDKTSHHLELSTWLGLHAPARLLP